MHNNRPRLEPSETARLMCQKLQDFLLNTQATNCRITRYTFYDKMGVVEHTIERTDQIKRLGQQQLQLLKKSLEGSCDEGKYDIMYT